MIANGIGITNAQASQRVDKRADEGLLGGVLLDARRQVLIHLTERSERVAAQIHRIRPEHVRRALETLSPQDAASAPRVFGAFIAALNAPLSDDARTPGGADAGTLNLPAG